MISAKAHLSVSEAAEELGISKTLLRDLIDEGQLVAYRFGPRKMVIYREDLETFRQSRKVKVSNKGESS